MLPTVRRLCLLLLGLSSLGSIQAAEEFDFSSGAWGEEEEFLHVDEAFVLTTSLNASGNLVARWDMPDGYYLYRHQFDFAARDPQQVEVGEALIAPGKHKVDEYFGEVEVYYHSAEAEVPLAPTQNVATELTVTYQGCADAGLCYPPETKRFAYDGVLLSVAGGDKPTQNFAAATTAPASTPSTTPPPSTGSDVTTSNVAATEEQLLAGILANESLLYALGLFFLAGIGLAFTPCVLPMVPILSSIIVGEGEGISKVRAATLSLAYVLGMAATYALVGTLVGLFGAELNLQAALQSPTVLVVFAVIFVALSLAMFGYYELQLPQSWQDRLNALGQKQQGGKHASVLVMGAVSSLVVSPCVSAPLAGALIYISTTNDAVLGGSALLALGLGMGVPLMIVGASGGHWLPRAGAWMNTVKAIFGVMLLAVAVWLLERVVPAPVTLALWASLLIGSGVYLGALDFSPRSGVAQFGKALGAMGMVWGVLLLIGAASGANDPLKPLARLTEGGAGVTTAGQVHSEPQWLPVKSLADVQGYLQASPKPVLLDLYADWCISCKTMERNVFPAPGVASRLAEFTLLRADVTANDPIDKELLNHYGLFGPPSLVFFAEDGSEMQEVRIQGEVNADTLETHLGAVLRVVGEKSSVNVGEIAANFD